MDGLTWTLDPDAMDRFEPHSHGWEYFRGLSLEEFPGVRGRSMVHTRDFWTRGAERLVVESNPEGLITAVLLNGKEISPLSGEEFDAAWMQKGL